jgi:hypothetical protein
MNLENLKKSAFDRKIADKELIANIAGLMEFFDFDNDSNDNANENAMIAHNAIQCLFDNDYSLAIFYLLKLEYSKSSYSLLEHCFCQLDLINN